ncbi:MAG: lyase [Parvularculaceae bacterium]
MRAALISLALAAGLIPATVPARPAAETTTVDIKEWRVPWENARPRDPFAESASSVWFVGQRAGFLARLDVETGDMTKVQLEAGSGPHNLVVDADGYVWYAGNRKSLIGRYDPQSGALEKIPMPDSAARDPHTLVFDGDGNIWFTVQGGNFVGRLNMESRKVDLVASKTARSRPYGIRIAPDGIVWAALFGTNKLARIDPATMALEEIALPRDGARPRRLDVTSDGRVWYVDYATGRLGAYDPKTDDVEEWLMPPGEDARPYGMAADSHDRLWMVATGPQPNLFIGFDPKTESFVSSTPVPSGGGTVRHMHYHQPSGAVWFGTDANTIGRAIVEPDGAE